MSHGTDRQPDAHPQEITLSSVANPRRVRVDAQGRPEPVPAGPGPQRD